jgi:UDP-MurNAc hydroxylase
MKIEFVNHSSFIVEHAGVRIICDPWLEGKIFNNGWDFISKTQFQYEDFKNINYIWFSHEHPDHFYPPNVKKIPEAYKKNITVLFQYTKDKRVVNYCRKQGFKEVIELVPEKWQSIGNDFKVLCEHYEEGDSWICFKGGGLTYLNTNDCGIRNKKEGERIRQLVGDVDVLLTQFSYAYWVGNPDEKEYRKGKADEKLKWMAYQCELFKPKVLIPIASYVYFCHEENNYLNDHINTARKTFEFTKANTTAEPVILYVGDTYNYPEAHDSMTSISKYEKDLDNINSSKLFMKGNSMDPVKLKESAENLIKDINTHNRFYVKQLLKPAHIFVTDYNKAYSLSLTGFKEISLPQEQCDVSLGSESLDFCLLYPYGLDTTQISGRMTKPKKGNYTNFYNFFRINQLKSRGEDPNAISYLVGAAYRKVKNKLGIHEY